MCRSIHHRAQKKQVENFCRNFCVVFFQKWPFSNQKWFFLPTPPMLPLDSQMMYKSHMGRNRSTSSYKTCQSCGDLFYPRENQLGQRVGNYNRKYCFKCLPYTGDTRRGVTRLNQKPKIIHVPKCKVCSRTCRNNELQLCGACSHLYRKWQLKRLAIIQMSGKCNRCGLESNLQDDFCLFDYHHIDESMKTFEIGDGINRLLSWEVIQAELYKCELLCVICHRKHHSSAVPKWFCILEKIL